MPDDAAIEAAALAETVETKLIDASSAHRTAADWAYGFPELGVTQRQAVAAAHRISNPGCYPTGFLALARPLIAAGVLLEDALLTVPAISGYSGGGKAMIAAFDGHDMPPAFSYGTSLKHKHLPEMTLHAGLKKAPIFMPSVGAFYAGMLVHLPLHVSQFTKAITADELYAIYADCYPSTGMVQWGLLAPIHRLTADCRRCAEYVIWKFCVRYGPKPILAYGAA